jgi:putative transposase
MHHLFKRRIKTQTILPSADTAAMFFWSCSLQDKPTCARQMVGRRLHKPIDQSIDLAA